MQQKNTTAINAAKAFMTRGVYFYDFYTIFEDPRENEKKRF